METLNYPPIHVAVVSNQHFFRLGMQAFFINSLEIKIVSHVSSGMELIQILDNAATSIDVVFVDATLSEEKSIDILRHIKDTYQNIKIIVTFNNESHYRLASESLHKSFNAYLLKSAEPEKFEEAISVVHKKGDYLNDLISLMASVVLVQNDANPEGIPFSEKEIAIIKFVSEDKTAKQIGEILSLSPRTVEAIREKIKEKMGVKSMAAMIVWAITHGLLKLEVTEELTSVT